MNLTSLKYEFFRGVIAIDVFTVYESCPILIQFLEVRLTLIHATIALSLKVV